jgi:hypothetical protein
MNQKYAVFVNSSYYVEGDERSRTNPGHGYPSHTEKYVAVIEFETEEELKDWILKNESKTFKVVTFTEISYKKTVNLEIDAL